MIEYNLDKKEIMNKFPRFSKNTEGYFADEIFNAIVKRLSQQDVNNSQVSFAIEKLEEDWEFEGAEKRGKVNG